MCHRHNLFCWIYIALSSTFMSRLLTSQKIMKTQSNICIPSLLEIREKSSSSIPAEFAGTTCSIFLAFRSADSMSPRRSQSSGARRAISRAIFSIWKSVSCFSKVFKALKCYLLSLWDNSLILLAYFFFMISWAQEEADFEDFGWSRKASQIFAVCRMRSSVHRCIWYLVSQKRQYHGWS